MATRKSAKWISVVVILLLALMFWITLFTGTASAQYYGHTTQFGRHGMMGYPIGAATTVTDTTAYGHPQQGWRMYDMIGHDWDDMPCFPMTSGWGMHNNWRNLR